MGHDTYVITSVLRQVETDYPPAMYKYQVKKRIPGSTMMPDIFVLDEQDRIVCAVEIGYTRPEKLTAYRHQFRIPDVRWYDKAGKLHPHIEVQARRVEEPPCLQRESSIGNIRIEPTPRLVYRYADLFCMGIVTNRVTLRRWIASGNFPPAIRLSANTIAWRAESVFAKSRMA